MKVRELRDMLASFDDDMEVYASPQIRVERLGENRDIDVPHPKLHYEIEELHIIGDIDKKTLEVGRRYIVLAFHDPEISERRRKGSIVYDKSLEKVRSARSKHK